MRHRFDVPKTFISNVPETSFLAMATSVLEMRASKRSCVMPLLINGDGSVWLQRRPSSGLWGGLWCPPQLDDDTQLAALHARRQTIFGKDAEVPAEKAAT